MRCGRPRRNSRTASAGGLTVAILALALGLSGCGNIGRTLSQRSLTVIFTEAHTTADVTRVRRDCDGVGRAKASAPGKNTALNRRYPLHFDVTGLSARERAKIVGCLSADPAVRGVQDSESTAGG